MAEARSASMSSDRGPVLSVRGLSKAFRGHLGIGRTAAVTDLTFEVGKGEVIGLLGPNGAGKTTTMKMILGLIRPDAGEIRLLGGSPADPVARARLGFLPENPYFYDYLTGREFLDFYARLRGFRGEDRRRCVDRALKKVGLEGRADRALRKYSKGMVQRVGLAQAIQHDPELVLLDEPMSGLDPIGRREVRDIILELRDAGKTVLFSSHILQDAELVCDRVAILRDGKLVSLGRLDEMIEQKVQWIEVMTRGTLPAGIEAHAADRGAGQRLIRVEDAAELARLLGQLEGTDVEVLSVWSRKDSLEDLFLHEIEAAEQADG